MGVFAPPFKLEEHILLFDRLHNKYHKTAPKDAVFIGRGSPYGNPYVIGEDGDRDAVCDMFEQTTLKTLDLRPLMFKHIVCYCKPKRCHGMSILKALEILEDEELRYSEREIIC